MDLPTIQVSSPTEPLEFLELLEFSIEDQPSLPILRANSDRRSRTTSRPSSKKVEFSDATQYSDSPTIVSNCDENFDQLVISATGPQPLKGILKSKIVNNQQFAPFQDESVPNMLQSYLNALAVKDLELRRETYTNFTNTIKECDKDINLKSLKFNLFEICQYIERDLRLVEDDGKPNSSLIVHALSLLRSLQSKSDIVGHFPIDFQIFLIEFCIEIFPKPLMSKDVKKNLIFSLSNQKFSPKVTSSNRIGRLIVALNTIEKYTTGKSIVLGRTKIYRGLLQTSRQQMITHNEWIKDLLTGMTNNFEPIQISAITFGFEVSVELGTEHQVSTATYEFLKSETEEEKEPYWVIFIKNLIEGAKNEPATHLPKVWSVLILLQRYKPLNLIKSIYFKPLLEILTSCFNSTDVEIQNEARFAWNRFIFSIQLNEETPEFIRNMLFRPYLQSLRQQKSVNFLKKVYNLLYYAFRPMCSSTQLDLYWDEYLKVFISQAYLSPEKYGTKMARKFADVASTVLIHLFDRKNSRIWTLNKVVQGLSNNDIAADELPALESKWLRKNFARVSPVLLSMFKRLFWDFSDPSTLATKVWDNYITSIASPAIMEITVSPETMGCISSILELLSQVWDDGVRGLSAIPPSNEIKGAHEFLNSAQMIISTMISGLGISAFMKRNLNNKMAQNTLMPVSKFSLQPFDKVLNCRSPLHHLVLLLIKPCPGMKYDSKFLQTINHILNFFFEDQPSRASKLAVATELACLLPISADNLFSVKIVWQSLADFAAKAINSENLLGNSLSYDDISNVIEILKCGIKISPHPISAGWEELFKSFSDSVALAAGTESTVQLVIRPISMFLCETCCGPSYLSSLIPRVEYPYDLQTVKSADEFAAKKLSHEDPKLPIPTSSDLYFDFYEYFRSSLKSSYRENYENSDIIALTNSFLKRLSNQVILHVLFQIQDALSPWIIHCKVSHSSQEQSILLLWSTFNSALVWILENGDPKQVLHDLECLICSGFESENSTIVSATIETWDSIYGTSYDNTEYPERLKTALCCLKMTASNMSSNSLQGESSSEKVVDKRTALDCQESSKYCVQYTQTSSNLPTEAKSSASPASISSKSIPQVVIEIDDSIKICQSSATKNNGLAKKLPVSSQSHDRLKMRLRSTKSPVSKITVEKHRKSRPKELQKAQLRPTTSSSAKSKRVSTASNSKSPLNLSPPKPYVLPTRRSNRLANDADNSTLFSSSVTTVVRKNNEANQTLSLKQRKFSDAHSSPPEVSSKIPCNKNSLTTTSKSGYLIQETTLNVSLNDADELGDNSTEMYSPLLCLTDGELLKKSTSHRSRKRKFVADNEVPDNQGSAINQSPNDRATSKRRRIFENSHSDAYLEYQNNRSGSVDLDAYRGVIGNSSTDLGVVQITSDKDRNQQKQLELDETTKIQPTNVKGNPDEIEMINSSDVIISSAVIAKTEINRQNSTRTLTEESEDGLITNIVTICDESNNIDKTKTFHAFQPAALIKSLCLENESINQSLSLAEGLTLSCVSTPLDSSLHNLADTNISTTETENSGNSVVNDTQYILNTIDRLISTLRSASLKKEDVSCIEDRLMDSKRALYEAEKRGRQAKSCLTTKSGIPREY